jgi:hypothetical protein
MSQALFEKITHIESLLLELNSKIDNFLGFEEMGEKEKEEVNLLRLEVRSGKLSSFDEVFQGD